MSLTVKIALSPLLVAQGVLTRRRLPRLPEPDGERHGIVGRGTRLRLLIAGDSAAAGVGVVTQRKALAVQLAAQLATALGARVAWRLIAQSGLTTAQTLHLLQREPAEHLQVDLAVIVTGVNDVVDQVPSHHAVAARERLANWLRNGAGVQHVVYAPLPPVHLFHGLPQPLRWVAGSDAKRHNAAMARWVRTRGDVSLVDMQLPLDPSAMASDGFHPGEPVYRYSAEAIARHVADAVWPAMHKESTR
jgi:lysophospholipase L1-like esterase